MNIRHYIHYIISIYLVFGGLLTNNSYYTKLHFYVTFFVMIHWLTNNGQCFLSQQDYDTSTEPNGYSKHLLSSLKISLSSLQLNLISWGSVLIPCLYSLYRLNIHNIHPYLLI